jgi:hypothetical protein
VRELYVESLYLLGIAFCDIGNLEKGYDYIARAEANLAHLPMTSTRLRVRISIEAWRLRDHLLVNARTWYPLQDRLNGLTNAFEQAYASGWHADAIAALLALTEHHAIARSDDEAMKAARAALLLAGQQGSKRVRTHVPLQIAAYLMQTKYRGSATSLLPTGQQIEYCDSYSRGFLSYVLAERALRLGAYQNALALTDPVSDSEENDVLKMFKALVAAAAAHELHRKADARELIESVIPAAERLGSAPTLKDAYGVAARITGDARFSRRSAEIARMLTSEASGIRKGHRVTA